MAPSDIVVITAASGRQCRFLTPILLRDPSLSLRLVVNSSTSRSRLKETYADNKNVEVVQANLLDTNSCASVLEGATTVYHVNPNHPKETQIGINMVSAAVAEKQKPNSKFQHFVLSSVYCTQLSKILHHARKLSVEEYLLECAAPSTGALNWTIIQPGHLAEALITRLVAAVEAHPGEKEVPFENQFDPNLPFAFLSLRDLAEVSARVIEERQKHYYATYGLTSTSAMPYKDFIKQVGDKLNINFKVSALSYEKAVDTNCKSQFGTTEVDQATRDGPERLVLFYSKRSLLGNPNICSWMLGREPSCIQDMVDNVVLERQ